jgi:hypothetical protein
MRSSNGDLTHRQDWVQDGTLFNVFRDVVGVFQQAQSHPRRGGGTTELNAQEYSRMKLGFIYGNLGYVQGFVLENIF